MGEKKKKGEDLRDFVSALQGGKIMQALPWWKMVPERHMVHGVPGPMLLLPSESQTSDGGRITCDENRTLVCYRIAGGDKKKKKKRKKQQAFLSALQRLRLPYAIALLNQ